jgi:hypothetical protein
VLKTVSKVNANVMNNHCSKTADIKKIYFAIRGSLFLTSVVLPFDE